ncbi:GGDEF domain-containing protein [Sporosarcina sp. GW1-11]|uniref:GGDEF domain-containing protein n=1 Tax=Sporosarcina sp. GW1-11 TaxID=2899126 RepID=UPI00294C4124|nr:GGDEF domain-containing protein [Sporosarcina sp. GW1-11]MDV6377064.1 GGDEF domain-containing protein [Sporosarcina sp. GW1-11]
MVKKSFIYVVVFLCTAALVFTDLILTEEASRRYPFIWTLTLIPSIIIINRYPKWRVIIGVGVFFSFVKYITVLAQNIHPGSIECKGLVLDSIINWSILLTVGYFIRKSHILLKKVEDLTITDTLTGIYNRRYFDMYMEKTIPFSKMSNSPLTFLMLDIDHFKKINDSYGHPCGDEALKHTSTIIKSCVRPSDAFVRLGGEEFGVVMPNTDVVEGLIIAERIRKAVEQSDYTYNNEQIHFTISIGLSSYNGEQVEQFIEKSDHALYQAKKNGRNQVVVNR